LMSNCIFVNDFKYVILIGSSGFCVEPIIKVN